MPTTQTNPGIRARCPSCGAAIRHLRYCHQLTRWGSEWGDCDLDGDNEEAQEEETNDSEVTESDYSCPECEADIGTIDYWETPAISTNDAISAYTQHLANRESLASAYVEVNRCDKVRMFTCPNCAHKRELDQNEEAVICDVCEAETKVDDSNTSKH